MVKQTATAILTRLAEAMERMAPAPQQRADANSSDAFVWDGASLHLQPVATISAPELELLKGVDDAREILLANSLQFARGFPANNALLWGARGMGKSSLIKAAHREVLRQLPGSCALVEIHREDILTLPQLMHALRATERRFVVFCDDLSFDGGDAGYKSLKTALEGGIEGRPDNVVFYATSNRRHLMPRDMIENERGTAISPGEAVEEKVSLSDRFGLWLGFHSCSLEVYLDIVEGYAKRHGLSMPIEDLRQQAYLWAAARGTRSGRVAWQFIIDLAGRMGKTLAS